MGAKENGPAKLPAAGCNSGEMDHNRLSNLAEKLRQTEQRFLALQKEEAALTQTLARHSTRIAELEKTIAALQEEKQQVENKLSDSEERVKQSRQYAARLENTVAETQKKNAGLEKTLSDLSQKLDRHDQERIQLNQDLANSRTVQGTLSNIVEESRRRQRLWRGAMRDDKACALLEEVIEGLLQIGFGHRVKA